MSEAEDGAKQGLARIKQVASELGDVLELAKQYRDHLIANSEYDSAIAIEEMGWVISNLQTALGNLESARSWWGDCMVSEHFRKEGVW